MNGNRKDLQGQPKTEQTVRNTVQKPLDRLSVKRYRGVVKRDTPASQSVKEPMFSLGEDVGSSAFRGKYQPNCVEKGVAPAPICKLFQVHGSVFEPDPSCDGGQTSVVCISHRVLLFGIRKSMDSPTG